MSLYPEFHSARYWQIIPVVLCLSLTLVLNSCQKEEATAPLPTHQIILNPQDSSMVLVPAGFTVLGNMPDGWGNYRLPSGLDTAWVDSFYIDRYEVTNQEYAAYLNLAFSLGLVDTFHGDVVDLNDQILVKTSSSDSRIQFIAAPPSFIPTIGYELTPVILVSWYGATAFAEFYNLRLPTEAEWEKAARGVSTALGSLYGIGYGFPYPWGDEPPGVDLANYGHSQSTGTAQSIFSYPQGMSWYGAFNMAGNVREWTDTPIGTIRVVRGGSYLSSTSEIRTAWRSYSDPNNTFTSYGFRCASDP